MRIRGQSKYVIMNYHNVTSPDMLNGCGLRTVLWVSGCTHACPECHNPITHDFNSGVEFTESALNEIIEKSNHDYIQGLTLSGGDPLMPKNLPTVLDVVKKFRSTYPNKTIWVYTGFKFEYLYSDYRYNEILNLIDVLVDGPFIVKLKNPLLHFRGSSNQRIIDVHKTLLNMGKEVILLDC